MRNPNKVEHLAVFQLLDPKWKKYDKIKQLLWISYLEGMHDGKKNNVNIEGTERGNKEEKE